MSHGGSCSPAITDWLQLNFAMEDNQSHSEQLMARVKFRLDDTKSESSKKEREKKKTILKYSVTDLMALAALFVSTRFFLPLGYK